ncbi:hypothetical protein RhiXN_11294 [Rhizoctonia solani]|uniref:Uncharacterized protein n=1 Tax=Rhizoctonia solani TaxID=456999 RepID=A0A8H8P4X1_9AGAM|nr:uncharacterized protein RhiXN_11294 [Rhizoctonia solani]QRW24382.1 hypothetical protein RhiXN_11294 [Rhizoctonia solani]
MGWNPIHGTNRTLWVLNSLHHVLVCGPTKRPLCSTNPNCYYKPYWEVTLASWRVDAELEDDVVPPKVWKDVDLAQPRPWWMPRWAMQVLCLEQGLPPNHPKDPAWLAMLGGCQTAQKKADRQALRTQQEWEMIPALESIDEAGESNSGSINNNVEWGLPTSSFGILLS